ncbi:defensin-like protein 71 [Raphanus sativus]|uniref:Defensin-like protein 71 n=1 Tax=Raphanus sativus TaxID=3726 RepID=A0A9W3CEE5_RAPSA|nr:defensin-like protein 71 [Raphanus sativus]
MNIRKTFVIFFLVVVLATSLLSNSNVLASPVINNRVGYTHCIQICTSYWADQGCRAECRKRGYSEGACIGHAPRFDCCCKK